MRGTARTRIRRASVADAPAVARVMRAAIRRLARGTYPPATLEAWSSLPALYHAWAMTAGGERYVVAERGGLIVGYAARREREVTAVFVRPGVARGGIGAALLRRVEDDARRAGIATAFVRAARGAVPFYAACGFQGRRPVRVPLPGGAELCAFTMRKRIASR